MNLTVEFTQEQYDRYKAGFKKLQQMKEEATDDQLEDVTNEQLIAQLKREASAITYAAEVGTGDGSGWAF
jgi:hypothetical protein